MATSFTGYPQAPKGVALTEDIVLDWVHVDTLQFDCQNGQRLDELDELAKSKPMIKPYHLAHCPHCRAQSETEMEIATTLYIEKDAIYRVVRSDHF